MTADSMLADATYGIARMKEGKEFQFYFRGTLASLKGAFDHLLEEYNQKFGLGIGPGSDLNPGSFRAAAKKQGKVTAGKFIDDFLTERKSLYADPKVGLLLASHGIRDLEIHREEQPRDIEIKLYETISMSARVEVRDPNGNLIGISDNATPPKKLGPKPPEFRYYLQTWGKGDDIPTLCDYCLAEVQKFVRKLEAGYP